MRNYFDCPKSIQNVLIIMGRADISLFQVWYANIESKFKIKTTEFLTINVTDEIECKEMTNAVKYNSMKKFARTCL